MGMRVQSSTHMRKYIKTEDTHVESKPMVTPIDVNLKFGNKEGKLVDVARYQKLIGKLILVISCSAKHCICCQLSELIHALTT